MVRACCRGHHFVHRATQPGSFPGLRGLFAFLPADNPRTFGFAAFCYRDGVGTAVDNGQYCHYLELAVLLGDAKAEYALGCARLAKDAMLFFFPELTTQDFGAAGWRIMTVLACCGTGRWRFASSKPPPKGATAWPSTWPAGTFVGWRARAWYLDPAMAVFCRRSYLSQGLTAEPDYARAVGYFQRAADQGVSDSMYNLGAFALLSWWRARGIPRGANIPWCCSDLVHQGHGASTNKGAHPWTYS